MSTEEQHHQTCNGLRQRGGLRRLGRKMGVEEEEEERVVVRFTVPLCRLGHRRLQKARCRCLQHHCGFKSELERMVQ
jgi:hypothetical protein